MAERHKIKTYFANLKSYDESNSTNFVENKKPVLKPASCHRRESNPKPSRIARNVPSLLTRDVLSLIARDV